MKQVRWILVLAAACLCTAMMGFAVYAQEQAPVIGVLPEGFAFQGESLAGMTVEEAKEKVNAYVAGVLERKLQVELQDSSYEISMDAIGMTWENADVLEQLDGKELAGNVIDRYKQKKDAQKNPVDLETKITYDADALGVLIGAYAEECSSEVEEPSLSRVNGEFVTVNGQKGVSFDTEKIQKDLEQLLEDETEGTIEYTAEAKITEPNVEANAYEGFRGDLLGTYTTFYKSSEANRSSNIRLASSHITDHSCLPGEEFSMLTLVGVVDKATGFLEAGTYENGEVVQGYGGGICQVATTIYDAALRAEMEIIERRNHSMVASYVPYAWDAMVYAQGGSDFRFINNTDYPIYVEIVIREGGQRDGKYEGDSTITVNIFGTETRPENRTIQFRSVTKEKLWPDAVGKEMYRVVVDQNLDPKKFQEEAAVHPQVKAECWKDIYVDGVLQDSVKINYSEYKAGTGVMHIGTDMYFKAWSVPSDDGWTKIHQDVYSISEYKQHLENLKKQEEELKKQEEAKKKHEEELKKQEEAAKQPAPEPAPAPAPEGPVDGQ